MLNSRRESPMPRFVPSLLWPLWAVSFALSAVLLALILDGGQTPPPSAGDTAINLNMASPGQWQSSRFHVGRAGSYQLLLSSVNVNNARPGRYLIADLEVAVIGPGDIPIFQKYYSGETIGHRVPDGELNTLLHELNLAPGANEPWTLKARVFSPDPNFLGVATELRLRTPEGSPPLTVELKWLLAAAVAILVALFTAWRLTRRKRWLPMLATSLCAALLLAASLGLIPA